MKKLLYFLFIFQNIIAVYAQNYSVLVYRSEYETNNDIIYDIQDSNEGTATYTIQSGNNNGYFTINADTGIIKIGNEIQDAFNIVHTDNLTVSIGSAIYLLQIVDAFDYYMTNLSNEYSVLPNDDSLFIDSNSDWTARNNLWGKGDAIENQDFRIVTLVKNSLPNETIILWDVPSKAEEFNGAAVWCYSNVFWGNRKNVREDLPNFPFKINDINTLSLDFDFEQLFGTHEYKVALNLFATDTPLLANFSENRGDFFFVFDQINEFLPNYPFSLPDITIGGKPFALLYDNENDGIFYERRRVIIKDGNALTNGTINLKSLFDIFSNAGYLNVNQSIPNIQVGLEITDGFGALRFNQLQFNSNLLSNATFTKETSLFYPNPVEDKLFFVNTLNDTDKILIYNALGGEVKIDKHDNYLDFSSLPNGLYFVKTNYVTEKIVKN